MNPYSFFMITTDDFELIKHAIYIYSLGKIDRIHCVNQLDGTRKITVHYQDFTNEALRHVMDEYERTRLSMPWILYYTMDGVCHIWNIFKTLTPNERTMVKFIPISTDLSKIEARSSD